MRSLGEWLAHQSQLHPQAIDLGLERLREILARISWRQPAVPVISIAGTNGKGSVAAYCGAMLKAAGYRVGTFTSPHLCDYRERIRIDDRLVTSAELVRTFERIEAARTTPRQEFPDDVTLTFFEYNALAAFLLFEEAQLDAWILEVGMGGRLDAVNAVDPTVAIVVSIGLDHQEFLGDTLDAIAVEKAGILRKGRPAVLGSRSFPSALLACAVDIGSIPKRLGIEFDFTLEANFWHYRGSHWDLPSLPPPALAGSTQFANAATAVAALEELSDRLPMTPAAIARGLRTVCLAGRFQIIAGGADKPVWILDVAHNPDAARVLARNLQELPAAGRTLAVFGLLSDKDAAGIAEILRASFDAWWLASTEGVRGQSAAELELEIAAAIDAPLLRAPDIAAACAAASSVAAPHDRIVVFGSFHVVGPALEWLHSQDLLPAGQDPEYTRAPF